jgi:PAS domain S-box-containing protein
VKKEKVNILIVDDKRANIFAMEQMLARPDRHFLTATNGNEALKLVLNEDISLIILDVQMPDMDGFEVAQIIKSNKRTRDIPIIFASAEKKERQFMVKGFEEGAIEYLHKPLDKDITQAKVDVLLKLQLQKVELQEKNHALERYALLINNSADLICIINPQTLKFEEVNQAVEPLLGYTPEEVRESSLLFYLATEYRQMVQKHTKSIREKISFETQVYTRSRSIRWFQWNIVHKNGRWFANARDITTAKEVEEIKSYLATVVKQSHEAVYLLNMDGKIISWNLGAEKIYGYTEQEALKMNIWNIVPEYLIRESHQVVDRILKGEEIRSLETKRITRSGRIIDVKFSATVITDSSAARRSLAITESDITIQKQAEQEIRQLNADLQANVKQLEVTNKELESFSYSVSHDLRAPLRAINGYAGIIREEYQDSIDAEQGRLLSIIEDSARKMGVLIDELLAFSKIGRKEVVKTTIHTREMVQQIIKEQERHYPDTKWKVTKLPQVQGDYTLLYQCLVNLISNAAKYSSKKPEPKVEIGSKKNNSEYIFYVRDNGSGFRMEYAHKLFGVFQRLHSDEEFEGTGVGLAIAQRIIVKHGGRIWAEGEVDKGATFYFSLPIEKEDGQK